MDSVRSAISHECNRLVFTQCGCTAAGLAASHHTLRWLAIALLIGANVATAPWLGRAHGDILTCSRILDGARKTQEPPLGLITQFGAEDCRIRKGAYLCMPSAENTDAEVTGEAPVVDTTGTLVCYTATCTGGNPPASIGLRDALVTAGREVRIRRSRMVCMSATPINAPCGNGKLDEGEECDPKGSDSMCPGLCQSDCTCPKCNGLPATIIGTTGDDLIVGTEGDDVIQASDGDDVVFGHGGTDVICGGRGNDTIDGGPGNDKLFGGPGRDVLFGGEGDDELHGEGGNDTLYGGPGTDLLVGDAGDDKLFGDADDTCEGDAGKDACAACGTTDPSCEASVSSP